MRNLKPLLLFSIVALSVVITFSFNNENSSTPGYIENLYNKIGDIKDKPQRRLAFLSLSSTEKFQLWEYKFQKTIAENKAFPGKIKFLKKVIQEFSAFSYKPEDASKRKQYVNENSSLLVKEAKKYFDEIEVHNLFYELVPLKISEFNKANAAPSNVSNLKPAICNCLIGHEGQCTLVYQDEHGGWHVIYGDCIDPVCTAPEGQPDCGFYWGQPCNGWRCYPPIPEEE